VIQQDELMFDGGASPRFVAGGQQVEQGPPEDGERQRAAGNANGAASLVRWLASGEYGKPIVNG
jgi:hypothetical protein